MAVTLPTTLNQLVQLSTLTKKQLLTHVQIFMNNKDANSERYGQTKKIKLYYTKHGSNFGLFYIFTGNFVKISLGRSCNHGISVLVQSLSITARAISYSFRDLSLLDIAYISCDIKEWQYSVLTSLRYVHLMQRGRKTIKIIWHSYIYSHFMPTCT